MKSKIKSYLKLALVFGISFLLFNCQNDTNVDEIISFETGNNVAFKKERLQDLDKLTSYVEELKRNRKGTSLNKESSLGDTYNFIIIEDQDVLVYEEDTNTTYTIPILKSEQEIGTFSNLVVKFSDTDQTEAFILNYEPNDGFLDAAENYNQTPFSGTIIKESLQYDGSLDHLKENANPNCTTITIKYCNWSEGSLEGTPHLAGRNCTPSFMFNVSYEVCSDFPELVDPPSSSSGNESPSSATTSTSSGSSNNDNNNPVTIPTVPRVENTLDIDGITLDMNNWLNNNLDVKLELITLLDENPGGEDFIFDAIIELMADDELTLEEYIASQIVFEAPENPIEDIDAFLSCFDTTLPAEFTVYVHQPRPGDRAPWTILGGIGHAYIGIKQGDVMRVLGLYPIGNVTPANPDDPRKYGDNSQNHYDVSITKDISAFQLWSITTEIRENNNNYNLNTNNCSTFALEISQLAGFVIPNTFGEWDGGYGNNPGDLGEDIRANTQVGAGKNLDGGTAPSNNGTCN